MTILPAPSQWRLILVDDDTYNREVIKEILEFYDVCVYAYENGADAIKGLTEVQQPLTAILLDLQMPGISGWKIAELLRSHERLELQNVPRIAVTAYAMSGDKERILQSGFEGYISKPVEATTLLPALQDILSKTYQAKKQAEAS
jgi:CheY-like chemotaxis protein